MKTHEANYTIGQELLRKAVTREKEASRYYGLQQYKVVSFFNTYLLSHVAFILIAVSSYAQQAPSSVVQLTEKDEPGKPLTLDIKVLDIDSKQPVAGVEVFAYHTNSKGDYEPGDNVARIHGTAVSDANGNVRFITIYPRGYNDSPTGEHIHFRIKGPTVAASNTDLMFADYYDKRYDYDLPATFICYLQSLEEKDGTLNGRAVIFVRSK
jgi:protocatechuate 3,4-dioxygenase beta subunit